jgi:TolB-like protein
MSLFAELKRRKVFRVAVVYAATAFVVLQAADIMLPAMGVPAWAMGLIVTLLGLGFPVALVLGWALELTPDGVRVTPPRLPTATEQPAPSLLGRRTAIAAGVLVVLGIGLGAGWFLRPVPAPGTPATGAVVAAGAVAAAGDRSVAVLPFADFSPGGDQEWFSDGLAEEILNALARLPDLRVASRTGSFQFRGHAGDVRAIADSLGVAHILEGSVRRSGDQLRITAQLIRAADDAHLWSQNFDRDAADVIRVQEEIALEIARTLQTALDPDELARMVAAGTNSVAAHEALLRYLHLQHRSIHLEDWGMLLEAYDALEEARTLDPQFYRAHAEAAAFWMGQLAPTNRAHGITRLSYDERYANALARMRAAESSAPDPRSRLEAERNRAQLEVRLWDVVALSQQIVELDPDGQEWYELGVSATHVGRWDLAREAFAEAAKQAEDVRFGRIGIAADYHRVDPAAALELIGPWLAGDAQNLDQLYQAHRILLAAGRVEQAAAIADAYLARSPSPSGRILARVRQLCGEGRTAEAEAYADSLGDAPTGDPGEDAIVRWHILSYLGRPAEAADVLRHYDDAGELYVLSTFLTYTFFDPRPFPNLSALLRRNGALRDEPLPIPYQCPLRLTD